MEQADIPKLIVTKGLSADTYYITSRLTSVGRALSNDFQLVAEGISRSHARLLRRGDEYCILDLRSKNGTYVNGSRIRGEHRLEHGDHIKLGRAVVLRFEKPKTSIRESPPSEQVTISRDLNPSIETSIRVSDDSDPPKLVETAEIPADMNVLRSAYRRLSILYEVNSSVGSIENLNELLEKVANIVTNLRKADRVAILLLDAGTGEPVPTVFRQKGAGGTHGGIHVSRTIVDKVISEKVGVLSSDALSDPRFSHAESVEIQNVRSVMCAPLKEKDAVIGVIYVDCRFTSDTFDEDDLRLLMAVCNEASIVIEAYRLALKNEQLTQQLIQAAKLSALGQFAAGIAHEIRNQLGAITLAELIREEYPDDERLQRYSNAILDARKHLLEIVSEVRDFSKNVEPKYELAPVPLADVIESALSLTRYDLNFRGKEVKAEYSSNPVVLCDSGKIRQVLINLLHNAAHATEERDQPVIRIEVEEDSDHGIVRVRDNGCGIAPEVLERIWEPFFTTRRDIGTGLGLDICKKIVGAHHGRITCESTVGQGTAFTICIPLVK